MENETVSKNFIENIIDKDLEEGVYDTVHTRFPPEPNGYLHIGHAKSILLNYGLAQKYNGKFNLRFDDTNPTKEKSEFVESIKADVKWLGADWEDRLFFASDYFDQMYEAAVKLIKKGKAFVCDLTADQIREYRGTLTEPGKESPYRNRTVEENLQLFEEMRDWYPRTPPRCSYRASALPARRASPAEERVDTRMPPQPAGRERAAQPAPLPPSALQAW